MHAKVNSIHGDYYCQVFGNEKFFVKAYPMENKSKYHEAMVIVLKDYGVPDSMLYNDAQ